MCFIELVCNRLHILNSDFRVLPLQRQLITGGDSPIALCTDDLSRRCLAWPFCRESWPPEVDGHELALRTVTARRFCDQQEISLHTATGRSLP